MKLGDVYKSYDLVRERAARVKKAIGLDWEIGGGSQVNLWVTLNDGVTLSEQAQESIVEDAIKVFNRFTPDEWNAVSAKQGAKDTVEIGASSNQVWCSFPHKIMSQLSVKDFVDLCNTFIQRVSSEIPKWVDKPSESSKPRCSMVKKIESLRNKSEANEPDINAEYNKFVDALDHYNDNTANFMKDCVYIAHSRGENLVNGLRKQGYKLNLAAQLDTDTLHTCYVKDEDGVHKAIDLYFNPHKRVVEVVLLGFDPNYPHAESTKIFSVQKGADAFADFIENVSNYKGESLIKKCSMSKKIESLRKQNEADMQYADFAKKKVADEYADEYGMFTDVWDLLNDKANELAGDILSENGIDDSEHDAVYETVYNELCKTLASTFGGYSAD